MYGLLQVIKEEIMQSGFATPSDATSPENVDHKNSGSQTDDCFTYQPASNIIV